MKLQAVDLRKAYGGVPVLRGVSIAVVTGQVTGIIGPNGAGKSTLVRLLAGEIRPDSGHIEIDGQRWRFRDPAEALRGRIALIPQELSVVPDLSVRENVLLGREATRGWFISRRTGYARVHAILNGLGMSLDPHQPAGELSAAARRFVMIARALNAGARFVIFDEPTAGLGPEESRLVLDLIKRLASQDIGIVFVSHKFDEVSEICDTCLVIREGIAEREINRDAATVGMLARQISSDEAVSDGDAGSDAHREQSNVDSSSIPVLSVSGALSAEASPIEVALHRGDIVGVYGLLASGGERFMKVLAGDALPASIKIAVTGQTVTKGWTPSKARDLGIGYVPGDRGEGVFPNLPVRTNVAMCALPTILRWVVTARRERTGVHPLLDALDLATRSDSPLLALSGGNRQKAVLARSLYANCEVLLLDDPCVGVDIAARSEIHRLCRELAHRGKVIVYRATAPEELLAIADTIMVFRYQTVASVRKSSEVSVNDLHLLSVGIDSVLDSGGRSAEEM